MFRWLVPGCEKTIVVNRNLDRKPEELELNGACPTPGQSRAREGAGP